MDILIPTWINGELKPVEKMKAHLQGLRHKAISVFVMQGSKTLLQRRTLSKYHTPGLWANACCTHPEWDEVGLDCATRRLSEELGIVGQTPVYRDTVEYSADVGNNMVENEVVEIFVVQANKVLVRPNANEVMDYRWETLEDLHKQIKSNPGQFTPWLKIYLEQHLILSALRIADEIARIDSSVKNCYLLGFDFSVKTGYTKQIPFENHHSPDYSEHIVSKQESALLKILAQENRLSIKINHVGDKSYSAFKAEEFNEMLPQHNKFKSDRGVKVDTTSNKVKVVAEITTNHQGDMNKLLKMITLANKSGADYVKLQKRNVETFYSNEQLEEPYDSPFGDSFRDYRHGIELTHDQFIEVDNHCKKLGIRWFVSILDQPSFDYMADFNLDLIKLPSTISEHKEYLSHVAENFDNDIVISTGYTDEAYEEFILEKFSTCRKLYLLQCTSAYPCHIEDAQIGVIHHYSKIASKTNIIPGYSSHDIGSICSMMAVGAGARMIEKHVKLGSVPWAHFDEVALDLGTEEFTDFVADIRKAEVIYGTAKKEVRKSEHHKYWLTPPKND